MKKTLSIFLVIIMVLGVLCSCEMPTTPENPDDQIEQTVQTEKPEQLENGKDGKDTDDTTEDQNGTEGLSYYPLSDGTLGVGVGTALYADEIVIPATYHGKVVSSIVKNGFKGAECTSITIPASITSIDEEAFNGCYNLTNVYITDLAAWYAIEFANIYSTPLRYAENLYLNEALVTEFVIPDSVTSIGNYAFSGCSSLTSIEIPNSVTAIGSYAFYECSGLTSIEIPNSVTTIGDSAFGGCSGLTSVTIGNSVTTIGPRAFLYSGLKSVTIGNSVTTIASNAFYACSGLTSVYYTGTAEEWSDISINSYNDNLTSATLYYYSETRPTTTGNYWHYVDGVPTAW